MCITAGGQNRTTAIRISDPKVKKRMTRIDPFSLAMCGAVKAFTDASGTFRSELP